MSGLPLLVVLGYCLVVIFFLTLVFSALSFAPWVPVRRGDVDRVFKLAALQPGETFWDLGCGDGRMVFAAARCGATAFGIEVALPLYSIAKLRSFFFRAGTAHIRFGDLANADLRDADVVYCFGLPRTVTARLSHRIRRELKPGARVVSYAFPIAGIEPFAVDRPSERDMPIFLYVCGERMVG